MLLALGAASSAVDPLKSLTSSKSRRRNPPAANRKPFDSFRHPRLRPARPAAAPAAAVSQISPADHERAAGGAEPGIDRIDHSAPTSRSDALKDLFSQIDADGDGKITKSEFENALGAGGTNLAQADDVFSASSTRTATARSASTRWHRR